MKYIKSQLTSNTYSSAKPQGFTLLEVLIALIILAIAFSTAFLSLTAATRHLITLHDKTAGEWVGMNVIAKAQLGMISANGGTGTDKMFTDNWSWNLSVSPTNNPGMSRAVVTVHKETSRANSVLLTGFIIKNTIL